MLVKTTVAAGALLLVSVAAQAQPQTMSFEQVVYVTCKEAHAMQPETRKAVAAVLAEHAARHHGVSIPNDDRGTQIGYLVRGGCTLAPDAYLFTVIDRAITAEMKKLPKRQ